MQFNKFKRSLDAIIVSKDISVIDKTESENLNTFMTYRWLSMKSELLSSIANIQVINSKMTANREAKLLMYNTPRLRSFNPVYIKK